MISILVRSRLKSIVETCIYFLNLYRLTNGLQFLKILKDFLLLNFRLTDLARNCVTSCYAMLFFFSTRDKFVNPYFKY